MSKSASLMPSLEKPQTFFVQLMHAQVGMETDLLRRLLRQNEQALHFKVLGKYDIMEFSKLSAIHEANKVTTERHILGITTFPCFYWNHNSQKFWSDISKAPSPSVVSIKVNEIIFDLLRLQGLQRILEYLHNYSKSYGKKNSIYPLSGLGHHEIILWYPSNNLQSVFSLVRDLRNLRMSDVFSDFDGPDRNSVIFLDTSTLPLVSYKNVISSKKWALLKGRIKPVIRARCTPSYEAEVAKKVPIVARDVLGEDDLIFIWNRSTPLKDFIPWLLNYRKNWQDHLVLMDTTTSLLSTKPLSLPTIGISPRKVNSPQYVTERLRKLSKMEGINQYFINEVICIVSLMNSYITRRFSAASFSDVVSSIPNLDVLLDEYIVCAKKGAIADKSQIEGFLLEFAESMRVALSQRFPGVEISGSEFPNPPPATSSVSRVIRAASGILKFLFKAFATSKPPAKFLSEVEHQAKTISEKKRRTGTVEDFAEPWTGFIYFDLTEGYQLYYNEIFSMPLSDLFVPLNWTTLSHELAHAYYQRISFSRLEEELLFSLQSKMEEADSSIRLLYKTRLLQTSWELFAHWFDYKHFYCGVLEFYLWNIWRTWLQVPRVVNYPNEYWVRSAFVKICHSWSELKKSFSEIDSKYGGNSGKLKSARMSLLQKELNGVSELMRRYFPEEFSKIDPYITGDDKQVIIESLYYFYHFANCFEQDYTNVDLLNRINKGYKDLDSHIADILAGKVISGVIENPFILVRGILKQFFVKNWAAELSPESTVSLIYSLWGADQQIGVGIA